MRLRRTLILLLLFTPPVAVRAEIWKLTRISTVGSEQCTNDEIVRASGLIAGTMVSIADLKIAANLLAQSGSFTNVTFNYEISGGNISVTFKAKDAEDHLAVRYENFVWSDDEGLQRYLSGSVPLFHGRVSRRGEMSQRIADALTKWLSIRGIPGTASSRLHAVGFEGGQDKAGIDAVAYVVVGVPMPVREVEFENAPNLSSDERGLLAKALMSTDYERTYFLESTKLNMRSIYSRKGMLKAQLGAPHVRLLGTNPTAPELAVSFSIQEGQQYKIADITWKRTMPEDLTRLIHDKPGAIADASKLNDDLEAVRGQLSTQGYLKAKAHSEYQFHDDSGTVGYLIDVDHGPQFHMGTVQFEGVSDALKGRLTKGWKLKPGDAFNSDYLKEFMNENSDSMAGHTITTKQSTTDANIVNLTIQVH